jgi:outer membrane protein assembly factor BamB
MTKSFILGAVFATGFCLLIWWFVFPTGPTAAPRVPIPENLPRIAEENTGGNQGTLIPGSGTPSADIGSWPQFRGPKRDCIASSPSIADTWPPDGPQVLWKIETGEGHAGVVIDKGCVFLVDYDKKQKEDVIRCLSLDSGEEIWRYTYSVKIKRNHGMSRTIPAIKDEYVVTLGPKCHLHCLKAASGELVWKRNLVKQYGAKIPEWYAGQCPLIDKGRLIIAPGGSALMVAIDIASGSDIWVTPNPNEWDMTHSSILPVDFKGQRQYVWCTSHGVVGVDAENGSLLWELPEWKIKIANVPTPIDLGGGKFFLSGGYNAGAAMVQLKKKEDKISAEILFRTKARLFGSDQQTPIYYNKHIYAVIPGGKLACLSPQGEQLWIEKDYNFGLGPYIIIDGKMLVLDDDGKKPGQLCLFKLETNGATKLASAKVIDGHDAWGPVAYAGGRAIMRDLTTLICLDLSVK